PKARIDFRHYVACHPQVLVVPALAVVVGLAGALLVHPLMFLVCAAGAGCFFAHLLKQRAKLIEGGVHPAMVIAANPWRVAVYANFCPDGGTLLPAVLVREASLDRMTGGPPRVGMALAAVAFYSGDPDSGAWSGFEPTIVHCATTDGSDIARVVKGIPETEWQRLNDSLSHIGAHPPTGLHKLWRGGGPYTAPAFSRGYAWSAGLIAVTLLATVIAAPVFRSRAVASPAAPPAKQTSPGKAVAKPSKPPAKKSANRPPAPAKRVIPAAALQRPGHRAQRAQV
ncbi:MAG TPA: DUF3239 domain-containing protein, partial [Tepidisphaeraceae bacterium]|nr:DUF3239 domain-containing protein [Tepidisphaeraceae bacterium]